MVSGRESGGVGLGRKGGKMESECMRGREGESEREMARVMGGREMKLAG